MASDVQPHRGRGRPRTPGAEEKVLAAALEEYGEHAWAGFTMDAVARRAGVGKSTVYLRWPDKDKLLTEAVRTYGMELTSVDTGSFAGDLHELTTNLLRHYHSPAGWATLRVVFDAASSHERLGDFADAVRLVHAAQVAQICRRAVERGELDPAYPPTLITEVVYGDAVINSLSERLGGRTDTEEDLAARASLVVDLVLKGVTPA